MFYTDDPLDDYYRYEAEQERKLKMLPKCCECDERIQEEYLFDIDGDLVCEDCLQDYMQKHFRQPVENYIEE